MLSARYKIPPLDAEQHLRSDYVQHEPGPMSDIIPGKRLSSVEKFKCPLCCTDAPPPEHGHYTGCTSCDLKWVSFGNALYLWR
jgi:hypothetical protein